MKINVEVGASASKVPNYSVSHVLDERPGVYRVLNCNEEEFVIAFSDGTGLYVLGNRVESLCPGSWGEDAVLEETDREIILKFKN